MKPVSMAVCLWLLGALSAFGSEALMEDLDALRKENNISALALVIVDMDGELAYAAGRGTLSHASDEAVTPDTVFRLGSITKSFTALTLLRLTQNGVIDPGDRLDSHVDAALWRNPWRSESPVTLEQLLEHSAGFTGLSRDEWDVARASPLTDNLRRFADRHTAQWQPGLWSSYSNLGAGFVGLAMANAAESHYEALVQNLVLEPLGMTASGFDPAAVRVTGYDRDGRTVIPYWQMVYRPFGALNASPNDMARYVRLHLQRGRLEGEAFLPEETMSRVEEARTTVAARHGLAYGNGLGNYPWLRDGFLFHGHGGDADGYLARFAYSHELGRGYFLVINAFNNAVLGDMRRRVERHLVDGRQPPAAPPGLTLDEHRHAWIAGDYRPQTGRFAAPAQSGRTVAFRLRDGIAQYRGANGWVRLYPVAVGEGFVKIRHRGENRATAIFIRMPGGAVAFVDDRMNLLQESPDMSGQSESTDSGGNR